MSNGETPFFQTRMGDKFYNGTMPNLVKALERIADSLEAIAAKPAPPTAAAQAIRDAQAKAEQAAKEDSDGK